MKGKRLTAALAVLATAALALPAVTGAAATQLSAKLKGSEEVHDGDKNGRGEIFVKVKPNRGKVCFLLEFEKIAPPTAGHIHKGAEGTDGPVKVTLFEDSVGLPGPTAEGCVKKVRKKLAKRIAKKPERFYVNLHNAEFPDGAIRGQLGLAL